MSTSAPRPGSRETRLLLVAPVVFALHVYEEYPAFIEWMNRRVSPAMTAESFALVNGMAFVVTLLLALATVLGRGRGLALSLVAWLSFLMLANGVLHLLATAIDGAYAPGAITSALLYLPYFALAFSACRRIGGAIPLRPALTAAVLGALPMLAQGAAVLLGGRRLLW
jgi:hypothetical protein